MNYFLEYFFYCFDLPLVIAVGNYHDNYLTHWIGWPYYFIVNIVLSLRTIHNLNLVEEKHLEFSLGYEIDLSYHHWTTDFTCSHILLLRYYRSCHPPLLGLRSSTLRPKGLVGPFHLAHFDKIKSIQVLLPLNFLILLNMNFKILD